MAHRAARRTLDLNTPNVARMYDYYLGGKDNFAADREAAEQALRFAPQIRFAAQQNRAFMGRAVRHLAEAGIRQFLDVGTGLPTRNNVHEVAQRAAPGARVVYVDHDPVVLAHGRAILGGAEHVHILQADLRRPEEILDNPEVRERLDFEQPIAILLVAIVHFLQDADDPEAIVARFREALPRGGHLVLSHVCGEAFPESVSGVTEVYRQSSTPIIPRDPERIRAPVRRPRRARPGRGQRRPVAARNSPKNATSPSATRAPTSSRASAAAPDPYGPGPCFHARHANPVGSLAMATLVLLRHGESVWNAEGLFTGWVDVDLSEKGEEEAVTGGDLLLDADIRLDVVHTSRAQARDPHGQHRARRGRAAVDPGQALVAAQRAPLRRAPGQEQGADSRGVRRGAVHDLAPLLRHPAAPDRRRRPPLAGRRPALPDAAVGARAPHRVPGRRRRPDAALLVRRDRAGPRGWATRSWSPRTATPCARWSSTSTASPTRRSPG